MGVCNLPPARELAVQDASAGGAQGGKHWTSSTFKQRSSHPATWRSSACSTGGTRWLYSVCCLYL